MNQSTVSSVSEVERLESSHAARPGMEHSETWQALNLLGSMIQWLIMALMLDILLFAGSPIRLSVQLIIVAVVLFVAARWSGSVVLVAMQLSLFFREPADDQMIAGWGALLYCTIALALIAVISQAQSMRQRVNGWFANQMFELLVPGGLRAPAAELSYPPATASSSATNERVFQLVPWLALLAAVLVASLVMRRLPITSGLREQWLQYSIAIDYVLWPGASIIVVAVALLVFVRESGWRQMTNSQAQLFLRCSFVLDHFHDLRLIALRRLKKRRGG